MELKTEKKTTNWLFIRDVIAVITICVGGLASLWYSVSSLVRWTIEIFNWVIEILGYPFWLVFTKLFNIDITRFESFWAFIGIFCIAHVVIGSFKLVYTTNKHYYPTKTTDERNLRKKDGVPQVKKTKDQ